MKLDRRTVLAGTAAAFAAPCLPPVRPAPTPSARRWSIPSLESARKVLTGKDFPDAAEMHVQGARAC